MATIHHQPLPLEAALAMLPSLPRPVLSRLVTRMIEHIDSLDGDTDLEEDDPDTGAEDAPEGFDPESDFCLAHEDSGTQGWLTSREKKEVRRIKLECREIMRAKH